MLLKILIILAPVFCVASDAASHFYRLKELDTPHPFCEGPLDLQVGNEYFVEIANPLLGRTEYNSLVKLYRTKSWERLDAAIEEFRKIFETSPLIEAVAFLEAQSQLERLLDPNGSLFDAAEKKYREVQLLYPKSTLLPILLAGTGGTYLRLGLNQKALSIFERVLRDFPNHDLKCVSLMGKAEVGFQLHDQNMVKAAQDIISKQCTNDRVKIALKVRRADSILSENLKEAKKIYEEVFESYGAIVNHYFPTLLYNMGEIKYREGQFPSSRFYFQEFIKHKKQLDACFPVALKRLADISSKTNLPQSQVIGDYLAVRDQAPRSDMGRFSFVHALLYDFSEVSEAEQDRRVKVVDIEIEKIIDDNLRERAFLEKGLVLLEAGQKEALDYLVRLHEKKEFGLNKGSLGDFVRERLLTILELETKEAEEKKSRFDKIKDQKVFNPIETAYPVWLKGSKFDSRARELYAQLAVKRFQNRIIKKDLKGALEKLARWNDSELWPKGGVDRARRLRIGYEITKYFMSHSGEALMDATQIAFEQPEVLEAFLRPEYKAMLGTIYRLKKETVQLKEVLGKVGRVPASMDSSVSKDVVDYLWRQQGLNYGAVQQFAAADEALKKVRSGHLLLSAKKDRLNFYWEAKQTIHYFNLGIEILPEVSAEERENYYSNLIASYYQSKIWNGADRLVSTIGKLKLEGKLAGQWYLAAGRGFFEKGKCPSAIKSYTLGFTLDTASPYLVESKFRYGKCQWKEKNKEFSRKAWEEVVAANDAFWSPLAKNELKAWEGK